MGGVRLYGSHLNMEGAVSSASFGWKLEVIGIEMARSLPSRT